MFNFYCVGLNSKVSDKLKNRKIPSTQDCIG